MVIDHNYLGLAPYVDIHRDQATGVRLLNDEHFLEAFKLLGECSDPSNKVAISKELTLSCVLYVRAESAEQRIRRVMREKPIKHLELCVLILQRLLRIRGWVVRPEQHRRLGKRIVLKHLAAIQNRAVVGLRGVYSIDS